MYENLLNKPESYRKKAAVFSSIFIFMLIVGVWTNVRGFWTDSSSESSVQVAEDTENTEIVLAADKATKPTETVSKSFSGSIGGLISHFDSIKESLASVFVPFITGIEVYDSSEK